VTAPVPSFLPVSPSSRFVSVSPSSRFVLDSDHPVLGELFEELPSLRMAIGRARLHESEGAHVVILRDGGPVYETGDGVL